MNKKRLTVCLLVAVFALLLPLQAYSLPGDADDPLVSKSWVDNYVEQTVSALEQKAAELMAASRELLKTEIILTLDSATAYINGQAQEMGVAPKLITLENGGGVTLVPLRFVGQTLDFTIGWDNATRSVLCYNADTRVSLILGAASASVNEQETALQAPAIAENGATLVPLRFISQAFDCQVEWIGSKKQIKIVKY